MKKQKNIFNLAVLMMLILYTMKSSHGFLIPLDTIDGVTDSGFVTENLSVVSNVTNTALIQKAQKGVKNAKAKYDEYKGYYEGVYNKEKAPLDGSKTIEESTIADISNPESIRRAMYDLFMVYPSNDEFEREAYTLKAKQFYQDTVIELYTTVRLIEQDFNDNIEKRIATMSQDLLSGENGASNTDDENGSWKNAYNAYKTMDDLMQILEELTAMKAQYEAVRAIKNNIRPVESESNQGQKQSGLEERGTIKYASSEQQEILAFAQIQAGSYNYKYDPDKDSPITFKEAPDPEIESPFASNRDVLDDLNKLDPIYYKALQALDIHNLLQSLPSQKRTFDKYEQFVRLHDKSVEAVKISDKCVLDYLGRYYEDKEKAWYGRYIGDQITDYDIREGLSGWSIAAYDTAKAEETDSSVDTSIFSEMKYDENIDNTSVSSVEAQKASIEKESANNSGFVTSEDEEQANEENRKLEILAWNIGSEAAKMLAEDQYSDNPQWGKVIKKFPVWNDVKSYYGQYLDGKYENMKSYLNRLNFSKKIISMAQLLNKISVTKPENKAFATSQLNILAKQVETIPEIVEEIENSTINTTQASMQEDVNTLKKNKKIALQILENKKEQYLKEQDAEKEKLNENTKVLNRINYPEVDTEELVTEETSKEVVKKDISGSEAKIKESQEQIDSVTNKIAAIERSYISKEQNISTKYDSKLSSLLKSLFDKSKNQSSLIISGSGTNLMFLEAINYVNSLISKSETMFSDAKDYASAAIDRTKQDLYAMGDDLYLVKNEDKIINRHKELIAELKNLSFETMLKSYDSMQNIANNDVGIELITTAFQSALTTKACLEYPCDEADEEYYVSNEGKGRDFTAPKAVPNIYPTPIREIVHLDYVDYNNISKLEDNSVSKEGMINYGAYVPEIWKLMLKNPAYVEKDMDFSKALSLGEEKREFMRGGILPCRSGDYIIDATDDKAGYYVANANNTSGAYRSCVHLDILNRALGTLITIQNKEIKKTALGEYKENISKGNASELGTFLQYENSKFYFGGIEQAAYKRVNEILGENTDEDYETTITDDLYIKATFGNNQIGNFLKHMETERQYRQKVEEMKAKIDELQETLLTELKKAGYSPKEDFNLANSKDYEEAVKGLNNAKSKILNEAYTDLEEINNPTNNVVQDKITSIRNMLDAMTKDKNELLQISQNTISDSEFDESLKAEEANQAAANKYQEEADKAFEENIEKFPIPYCSVY